MSVQKLADVIATAVAEARSTRGMAEIGVVNGSNIVTNRGIFPYDLAVDIALYDGKQVWVQMSEEGIAVIVGE